MAESPQAPDTPVEPRTHLGRRAMDKVAAEAARSAARTANKANDAKTNARVKTEILAEKEKQEELLAKRNEAKAARSKLRWQQRWADFKTRAQAVVRVVMIVGPITAPMSVAWTGQIGFAEKTLKWEFEGGVVYAAAYELTTVFAAWMYHEARKDGDKGWEYRILTWVFAAGSGVQQWWHWSNDWHATPRAVTYSTMTAVGVIVWEAYARLIHRRKLREDGKLPPARPRIGLVRWLRYPQISWVAWSASVRHNLTNRDELWELAEMRVEASRLDEDKNRTLRKENRELKKQLADRNGPKPPKAVAAPDPETPTPDPGPTVSLERADLAGSGRTSPDLSMVKSGSLPEQKAIEPGPGQPESGPETDENFVPTELERRAVEELVRRGVRINRTTAADMVRELVADLGQDVAGQAGINTKRAALLAAWGRTNSGGINLKAVGE